jgi:hypothetical protein
MSHPAWCTVEVIHARNMFHYDLARMSGFPPPPHARARAFKTAVRSKSDINMLRPNEAATNSVGMYCLSNIWGVYQRMNMAARRPLRFHTRNV